MIFWQKCVGGLCILKELVSSKKSPLLPVFVFSSMWWIRAQSVKTAVALSLSKVFHGTAIGQTELCSCSGLMRFVFTMFTHEVNFYTPLDDDVKDSFGPKTKDSLDHLLWSIWLCKVRWGRKREQGKTKQSKWEGTSAHVWYIYWAAFLGR